MKPPIQCPCGNEPSAERLEIAELMPSLPAYCTACEERAAAADRDGAQCAEQRARERQLQERLAVIPPEIAATSPQDPRFNTALWLAVCDWKPEDPRWLGIVGKPGACKTRCLGLLARRLIEEGRCVAWTMATEFQSCVEDTTSKRYQVSEPARDRLRELKLAEIVVFDDLGMLTWHALLERHFFHLIDYRKTHYLPVLWSANASLKEMFATGALSAQRGGPIFGRLIEKSREIIVRSPAQGTPSPHP